MIYVVLSSAKKTCMLDPIPTPLVVNCLDVLLLVQTKIINTSIMSGQFADGWKCALVNPLLRKRGLDLYKNYRPISSLQYVFKLAERALFEQTHVDTCFTVIVLYRSQHWNGFVESYEWHHACYGLKLCHASCIVRPQCSVWHFQSWDPSVAKQSWVTGEVLNWFKSYLFNRSQRISVRGTLSACFNLDCEVPQGSCLGPLLVD